MLRVITDIFDDGHYGVQFSVNDGSGDVAVFVHRSTGKTDLAGVRGQLVRPQREQHIRLTGTRVLSKKHEHRRRSATLRWGRQRDGNPSEITGAKLRNAAYQKGEPSRHRGGVDEGPGMAHPTAPGPR